MSTHAEKLGKLETKSRKLILKVQFCEVIKDVVNGLVIVEGVGTGTFEPQNLEDKVVNGVIYVGLERLKYGRVFCFAGHQ
jgi:hypothetical protein